MEYKINEIAFPMHQIAAKLFNLEYLSDITFLVEGKQMFAHSLILMLRSTVFQKQLETTLGEKKILPITDCEYDDFYQLIQFIYTDQINVNATNLCRLLKLAIRYNVIRLINQLMNRSFYAFQKLNFYKAENHKIDLNRTTIKLQAAFFYKLNLNSNPFLTIGSDTAEEVFKFDQIEKGVTESHIFDALVRRMNHHCEQNQIQFKDCREKFIDLVRSIRFPTMSNEELRNIKTKYPDLLTDSDYEIFASHKIFGTKHDNGIWNYSPRTELLQPYQWKTYQEKTEFKTKFSVYSDMILHGFAFGKHDTTSGVKRMSITISCHKHDLSKVTEIKIDQVDLESVHAVVNLGTSIQVHPNFIYTIGYKYQLMDNATWYWSRKSDTDFIINAPSNSVKILDVHPTMWEITFFKPKDAKL